LGKLNKNFLATLILSCSLIASAARADFGFVLQEQYQAPPFSVQTLAFAPADSWFVAAVGQRGLVLAIEEGRIQKRGELRGPLKEVLGVAVSPDGQTIALVDAAGALHLYRYPSLTSIATVPSAHSGRAAAVAFTGDGEYVVTGGEDGKIKVWTPRGGFFAELGKGVRHEKEVLFVAGVPPGRGVLSVGRDRRVILWQVDTQQAVRPTSVEMDVLSAATGSGGSVLALGLRLLKGNISRLSTIPDARAIKATDRVRMVNTNTGAQLRDLEGGDQNQDAVAVTPDGRFVASAGAGRFASIWDAVTGKAVTNIPLERPATALAFAPNGQWLLLGTEGGELMLYHLSGVGPTVVPAAPPGQILIILIEPQSGGRGDIPRVETPSLHVRGRIKAAHPLKNLWVEGQEITAIVQSEEGDYVFTANIPLPDPGRREVEIVAEDQAGLRAQESFVVERAREIRAAEPGKGRRLALIVGISSYQDPSINLEFADDDAKALYDLLTSPELGPATFQRENVRLLLNDQATAAHINSGLREFLQAARENDFVLFYFAGHGVPDPNRLSDLYLMAHDTKPANIAGTGLLMRHVREAISEIEARDVLVLTDACHSAGMAAPKSIRNLSVNPVHQSFLDKMVHASGGLAILTASEAAQVSYENRKWNQHGVFTHFLLEGLKGAADRDRDRIVSLGELMEFVRDQVRDATSLKQIPAIGPFSFDRQLPLTLVPGDSP
jgi:WD40 repeat protein